MDSLKVIEQREVLGKDFKIYGDFDNPLFLAKDVAEWIGHSNPSKMVSDAGLAENEAVKQTIGTLTNSYSALFLTEDGLYEVLMQSRKPIARAFKREVKEILKSVRRRGMYATEATIDRILDDPDFGIRLLESLKAEKARARALEAEKAELSIQMDESMEWYTVKRVAMLNGINWRTVDWRALKDTSAALALEVKKVFDANYGEVNACHIDAWRHEYPALRYGEASRRRKRRPPKKRA